MKELLDTLAGWEHDGVAVGRAVVVRTFGSAPRPEGAVLLYAADGRIAGSVSGGCVEGAAAEEIDKARADGHARVIRYGISDEQAWDVGLACGGTIDVLVEPVGPGRGRHGRARRRSARPARARPSSRRSPPIRRRASSGRTSRAPGRRRSPSSWSTTRAGSRARSAPPELDAQLVAAAGEALKRGLSRTVELGGRSLLHRGLPGPPAARGRRGGRGRPVAGPARARARVRDGRHRRPRVVRDRRALPGRRSPDRRLARRGRRRDRARAERRGGRAHARRQVRRARDRRGAPPGLPLRRRRRVEEDAGRPARPSARGGRQRRGARPAARTGRASTSAVARRPRRRWRSWPRSSPSATAAAASRSGSGRWPDPTVAAALSRRSAAGPGGRPGLGRLQHGERRPDDRERDAGDRDEVREPVVAAPAPRRRGRSSARWPPSAARPARTMATNATGMGRCIGWSGSASARARSSTSSTRLIVRTPASRYHAPIVTFPSHPTITRTAPPRISRPGSPARSMTIQGASGRSPQWWAAAA